MQIDGASVLRSERDRAILSLVREGVGTQQELVDALQARGLEVTQATVSRDIKRLGLAKVGNRYSAPPAPSFAIGMEPAEGMLVVKTLPGRASAVACLVDEAGVPEIVATLAGDDTVLVLVRQKKDRDAVEAVLREIL